MTKPSDIKIDQGPAKDIQCYLEGLTREQCDQKTESPEIGKDLFVSLDKTCQKNTVIPESGPSCTLWVYNNNPDELSPFNREDSPRKAGDYFMQIGVRVYSDPAQTTGVGFKFKSCTNTNGNDIGPTDSLGLGLEWLCFNNRENKIGYRNSEQF